MQKNHRGKILIVMAGILFIQVLISSLTGPIHEPIGDYSGNNNDNNNITTNTLNDKGLLGMDGNTPEISAANVSSWWNESYDYRRQIIITNPEDFTQDRPITLHLDFDDGKAKNGSIRIVKYDTISESWTPVPVQVWDGVDGDSDGYLESANLTFIGRDLSQGDNIYFVYYDPDETYDPTDYSTLSFTSIYMNGMVNTTWKDKDGNSYTLELRKDYGANVLKDKYGVNYHTGNSSAPGILGLQEDLVAYWDFDSETFEDIADSGAIPDGGYNVHGAPYFSTGKFGKAAYFSGAGDYVAINSDDDRIEGRKSATNTPYLGLTLMAWVNLAGSGERIIASWDRSESWRFSIDSNNHAYFATADTTRSIDDLHGTITIPNGEWHHVTLVYEQMDGYGIKKIYVDGVLDVQRTVSYAVSLGYYDRYGFIGVGSESPSFDGNIGPTYYYDGALDEFRIYKRPLTEDEINIVMNKGTVTSSIKSITQIMNGSVFAQYEVKWEDLSFSGSQNMSITDIWTFYRELNMWKVTRSYNWSQRFNEPNNDFAAWNTKYSWDPSDTSDYYFYDGSLTQGHALDFTSENYTVLYDYDGNYQHTALGLFISEKVVSQPQFMTFNHIYWKINRDDTHDIVNFIPGNQTDIDSFAGDPQFHVNITFWEMIKTDYVQSPTTALTEFENIYHTLTGDVSITMEDEEDLFFNLHITVKDHDGTLVPGVNVSIYDIDNSYALNGSKLTDSNGQVSFLRRPAMNLTVNITYLPNDGEKMLELGEYNITLNETETESGNSKNIEYTVNLTSITLKFITMDEGNSISGANITFYENVTNTLTVVGTLYTDDSGNVTFFWRNETWQTYNISFTCNLLGVNRPIRDNSSSDPYADSLTYEMLSKRYVLVNTSITDFETKLDLTDNTPSYVYGEPLSFDAHYYYNQSNTITNISEGNIDYRIQYKGTDIAVVEDYGQTDSTGHITINIDYITLGYNLEVGKNYVLRVTASKPGYQTMIESIAFQITPRWSNLTVNTAQTIDTVNWTRNISISVHYQDTYYDKPLISSQITYSARTLGDVELFSGSMQEAGAGNYVLVLNSTQFNETGTYKIIITASNDTAAEQQITHFITIENISTSISSAAEHIETYWNDNFTLHIKYYNELDDRAINDGYVTWNLHGSSSVKGVLERDPSMGDGWYSVEINTTIFSYAGNYILDIHASKDNYIEQYMEISISVREIYTLLNGKRSPITTITLYRYDEEIITFNYTYRVGGEGSDVFSVVENATYKTYEWETLDGSWSGSGELTYNPDTKLYELDFDTGSRPIGSYVITVRIQEINYLSRVAVIYLNIIPIDFVLTIEEQPNLENYDPETQILKYNVIQGESETVRITLVLSDNLTKSLMDNATVVWTNVNTGETIEFKAMGNGVYVADIPVDVNAFYQQQLIEGKIIISASQFENVTLSAQIAVQMPEIFDGVPTFYFILGVAAVGLIVGALVVNKVIQNARIPAYIKMIDKTIKTIENEKEMDSEKLVESLNDIIINMYGSYWTQLDLDIKKALGVEDKNMAPGDEAGQSGGE